MIIKTNLKLGYSKNSSGYCNYTGDHYEHGNWTHYGPSYEVGDVVGCCINFIDKKVFYTKNGKNLGIYLNIYLNYLKNICLFIIIIVYYI